MPAFWSTNWTGKPELHKIVNVDDGRTHYFFDQAPKARTVDESGFDEDHPGLTRTRQLTGDDGGPSYEDGGYYANTDIGQVRSEWQRQFPGVAFPDPSSATPGAGINAQGNGVPGQFSGNEATERGNAGHGSWMDQQGGEILSDVLRGIAGFVSGGLSELMFAVAGSDGSAEDKRGAMAGAVGGLANSALDNIANSSASTAAPAAADAATSTSATTTSTTGLSSSPAQTAQVADTPAQALNRTASRRRE
jgi:hypothetical protein